MSHNLDFTTGRAAIAYAGELPWHRHGQQLDPNADLDTWRREAELEWHVERHPVFAHVGDVQMPLANQRALIRSDTMTPLSVVSDRYVPHQPRQVIEFFQDLISDMGFRMHTMGALAGGRQIWALAETGDHFALGGVDAMNGYLLLSTSYDKTTATTAMYTNVRVVCNNTLSLALNRANYGQNAVRAHHRAELDDKAIKAELGLFEVASEEFRRQAQEMTRFDMNQQRIAEYVAEVFKAEPEIFEEEPGDIPFPIRRCIELVRLGPGADLPTADGTLWGAFNAVTHYQDHESPDRGGNRWRAATFGAGATRKKRAWDVAGTMLEAA